MHGVNVPEIIGVMVLPDCVLFPHGAMPLRIFEPRYREMLEDALEGECIFGIVNKIHDEFGEDFQKSAATIGTVGLIRASKEQKDGTSELILHGFLRMKVEQWVNDRSYPRARITPITFELDTTQDQLVTETQTLLGIIHQLTKDMDDDVKNYIITTLGKTEHPHILADLVAQQFIRDPADRQALLDINDARKRLHLLISMLTENEVR